MHATRLTDKERDAASSPKLHARNRGRSAIYLDRHDNRETLRAMSPKVKRALFSLKKAGH